MKSIGIFILILALHELCGAVSNEDKQVGYYQPNWHHSSGGFSSKSIRRQSDSSDSDSGTSESDSSDSNTSGSNTSDSDSSDSGKDEGKQADEDDKRRLRIPQINFYNSIPNALGFTGQGFLWIRELSSCIGTPIVIFVMGIPMLLAGIGLIFIPDFTQLGLPLFYPGGGESDLPALEDLLPDLGNFGIDLPGFVKQAFPGFGFVQQAIPDLLTAKKRRRHN